MKMTTHKLFLFSLIAIGSSLSFISVKKETLISSLNREPANTSFQLQRETLPAELPTGDFTVASPYKIISGPKASENDAYGHETKILIPNKRHNRKPVYEIKNIPISQFVTGQMQDYSWQATIELSYNGDESGSNSPNKLIVKNLSCKRNKDSAFAPSSKTSQRQNPELLKTDICTIISHQIEQKSKNHDILRFNLSQYDPEQGLCTKTAHVVTTVEITCPTIGLDK